LFLLPEGRHLTRKVTGVGGRQLRWGATSLPIIGRGIENMSNKFRFRKKNGDSCGADAQIGKSVCVFHDPANAKMVVVRGGSVELT